MLKLEPCWQTKVTLHTLNIPNNLRHLLLDPHSMTQHMRELTSELTVKIIYRGWQQPFKNEVRSLNLPNRQIAFIREVEILSEKKIWMFARTVIPQSSLAGKLKRLQFLGERPLGDIIFKFPTITRSNFEISNLNSNTYLYQKAINNLDNIPEKLWARRSKFYLSDKPMLLTEVFTPQFCE